MNPIQMNCPACQKLFLVREEDLAPGLVRFQCTRCKTLFAFNWPQPPGTTSVKTEIWEEAEKKAQAPAQVAAPAAPKSQSAPRLSAVAAPSPAQTYVNNPNPSFGTRICAHCGEKVDLKYSECPKCGIVFDKVKKIRPAEPVVAPAGEDVTAAWENVKAHYTDEKLHEGFVQLCLSRDNLAFASSQYRSILLANPAEEIANRMQNKIVELATTTYLTAHTAARSEMKPFSRGVAIMMGLGGLAILLGLIIPVARSLIAIGIAFLVFVYVLRNFNRAI